MTFPRAAWAVMSTLAFGLACGNSDPATSASAAGSAGLAAAGANAVAGSGAAAAGADATAGVDAGGALSGGASSAAIAGAVGGGGVPSSAGAGGAAAGSAAAGSAGQTGNGGSSGSSAGANAGPPSSRQTAKPLGGGNTAPNGYFEYLPPGYDGVTATPLLVFWHGIGEDGNGGSDLQKVLAHGPPELISKDKWDTALAAAFIVLSPQYTPTNGEIMPGGGLSFERHDRCFLQLVRAALRRRREAGFIYLTGLSCGAIGSWDYLTQHQASVIAAAVLLSGNPGVPTQASSAWARAGCTLGAAAIWSLHGDMDPTVPYAPDHDTLTNLLTCPTPPRPPRSVHRRRERPARHLGPGLRSERRLRRYLPVAAR